MGSTKIYRVSDAVTPRSLFTYERQVLEEPVPEVSEEELGPEGEELTREAILAEARAEAAEKVKEAYAEGLRRGTEAAREQYLARVGKSAEVLEEVVGRLAEARESFLASLEPQILSLAATVIRKVFQRELQSDPDAIRRTVRRALEHLVERETVTVRIHPSDFEGLRAERVTLLEEFEGMRQMTLLPDASITPGGCIVESALIQIDARLESQLELLLNELLEGPSEDAGEPVAAPASELVDGADDIDAEPDVSFDDPVTEEPDLDEP